MARLKRTASLAAIAILAASAMPSVCQARVTRTEAQDAVSTMSSAIVGFPMTAVCGPATGYGNANISWRVYQDASGVIALKLADRLTIVNTDCEAIRKILSWRDHRWDFLEWNNRLVLGVAVLDIVHASMLRKLESHDEGVVECTAYQNLWPTVAGFKLPARFARLLLASAQYAHTMHAVLYDDGTPNPYRTIC